MTTPWTPPGEDLPTPASQPWQTAPPPTQPYQPTQPYPPAYQRQPPYPGGPHPDGLPPSKALAGWALALSFVGCLVVPLVAAVCMAVVVLVEGRRDPRDRGQGMAIGALVVSGLWVLVLVISMVANSVGPSSPSGLDDPLIRPTDLRSGQDQNRVLPSKLRVGDCFDDKALAGIDEGGDSVEAGLVTLVPCERPHDFEAYDLFRIHGDDFPGVAEVRRQSGLGCATAFKAYVGRAYGRSDLDYWVYFPTSRSWKILSDHGVTCVVGEADVKTTGSLRGSGR
jgi:hypothetical protein